ncbi:cysteine methyltransferase [Sphingomonas oleivorans]|uniref:Cysteine methyltransferase n=1 Tax=Sphingomonas oleivorans TaxID=1735121 RepID=A0A2T5G2P4_9SPHN|nr:methylated-DNA--[protein]-cysteine S-methyltransferase [Sphingomonas oleivorans]PTQ13417.1 cysteine methyltransferase [Sphingomonas oleivorans]
MAQIRIVSPIGPILLVAERDRLSAIRIGAPPGEDSPDLLLREAAAQIDAYFAGRLRHFDLPLVPCATERGAALRDALIAIPYGQTMSYGAVARIAGSGPRAIGQACRRNPLPIIVPCHRIVASNGIGNYSAGQGIDTKIWLIGHERMGD